MPDQLMTATVTQQVDLYIHNGADPGAFERYGEIVGTPGMPNPTTQDIDGTHMRSVDVATGRIIIETLAGPTDLSEITIPMQYEPGSAAFAALLALRKSSEDRKIKYVFGQIDTSAPNIEFSGRVKSVSIEAPMGDKAMCQITIKLTSDYTLGTEA